jgi:hypothetical protein
MSKTLDLGHAANSGSAGEAVRMSKIVKGRNGGQCFSEIDANDFLACHENHPFKHEGAKKNSQPIFTMKTVPESMEDELSRRNLLSGVHKGAGYQLGLKRRMVSWAEIRCEKSPS